MPSFESYKKMLGQRGVTLGDVRKKESDMLMEYTLTDDLQYKRAYIYDYYHDEKPWLATDMEYEETTKTPIDIKFIIKTYASLSKDQVEYYIQFRPSQKLRFTVDDDLYYYETDYVERYGSEFPVGCYIDIPDDENVYRKWLICAKEIANQFVKYLVLPCNYYYHWISWENGQRKKNKIWAVRRTQSSYNSGLWSNYVYTGTENQAIAWFPMNEMTEYLYYVHTDINLNQRIVMSARTKNPIVWEISKVENNQPLGIQKITLYQKKWNRDTDYIADETNPDGSKDLYAMYADYNYSSTEFVEEPVKTDMTCIIKTSTNVIKVGGSYKTLTATLSDENYVLTEDNWQFTIGDEDITASELITWSSIEGNKIKVKFLGDRSYLSQVLTANCKVEDNIIGTIQLEIVAL